ncbi:AfsR/SARP family transcriptional regulator [Actinopolyspora xinjiangensis]|uniref:AfsR/SARP family transcriptional regulator n=1 Tax=Actinopolyspora xinjiangensis TaxID=405564 RepID=UPI001FCDD2A9|nr:AfsR/SARP family transcriptional regulator [Actinopolyspora xinjiangensis]
MHRRTLLALLLLSAGKVVPREQLVEQLWGGAPPQGETNALQAHIARLRRDLERCFGPGEGARRLSTSTFGYSLHVEQGELDLEVFDTLRLTARQVADADSPAATEMLQQAVELWAGPAFAEVRERSARLYAAAVQAEEHYVLALEEFVELNLERGHYDWVIGRLKALTTQYPYRERLFEQLIIALGKTGRRAEAAEVFRRVRSEMVNEFGLEPSSDLNRAFQHALEDE